MRVAKRAGVVAGLIVGFQLLLAGPAHAYIDPGSGSYLLQILIGGVLGAAVAVKAFWRRIVAAVTLRRKRG